MEALEIIGQKAKEAKVSLGLLGQTKKNETLCAVADALCANGAEILEGNKIDVEAAKANGMSEGLLDRLTLTTTRIAALAEGLRKVASLPDPIGSILSMDQRPNGLMVGKKRVPLGVVGVIYESRPNVTSDVFGLCFKTGNAVILRGGSDCIHSNIVIVKVIREALEACGITPDAVQLLTDTSRETATRFM